MLRLVHWPSAGLKRNKSECDAVSVRVKTCVRLNLSLSLSVSLCLSVSVSLSLSLSLSRSVSLCRSLSLLRCLSLSLPLSRSLSLLLPLRTPARACTPLSERACRISTRVGFEFRLSDMRRCQERRFHKDISARAGSRRESAGIGLQRRLACRPCLSCACYIAHIIHILLCISYYYTICMLFLEGQG